MTATPDPDSTLEGESKESSGDEGAPEEESVAGGTSSLPDPARAAGRSLSPAGRSLSPSDLERVIRRASDLQFRAGTGGGESALDEAEVVRIGEEVGLAPRYVRQAVAEIHADSLVPALPREARLPARLWGSGLVRASRVVPGDPTEVTRKLERHLRDRELLTRVRHQPGRSLWEPAGGLLSTMKRAMNVGGHGYELAKARSVELVIEALEAGWSLVTLTADLRNERAGTALGWHIGGVVVGISAAVGFALSGLPELLVLGGTAAASGVGLGGATWATAAHYRKRRSRTQLVLEGLLDRLELGEPLTPTGGPSWREKLLE